MAPSTLVSLIDRPARDALTRAQSGVLPLVAPALVGLALVTLTSLAGLLLGGRSALFEPMTRALLEALLLATPVLLVVTTVSLPALAPGTTLSALSISLGVAGLASSLMLPWLAFLRICTDDGLGTFGRMMLTLAAPAVFLVAVSVVLSRTLSAFSNWGGERLAWLFGLMTFSVFLLRLSPHFTRLS